MAADSSQVAVTMDDDGTVRRIYNPSQKFVKLWEDCENKVHIDLKWDSVLGATYITLLFSFVFGFLAYGLYRRRVELRKLEMGSRELRELNYSPRDDSAIFVRGTGLHAESRTLDVKGQNGFLSFAGRDKDK
ncbi:Hypothetical Protein FCC1311_014872 [Hondaea fermentalgiana]|uniref:Uncharacterized protein n=1 Tax=Hondaea fermentalgiana TaxID=2315210 RepID=A0A2R5G2N9_9STRA|nr:Hypothetical Protein FCC1311_014872 [Hondaea fermentalgiana]|eukprot:GBG25270.1 Hypothetical Protein FCC1311_014872 [Hondaea fermentalgiana]